MAGVASFRRQVRQLLPGRAAADRQWRQVQWPGTHGGRGTRRRAHIRAEGLGAPAASAPRARLRAESNQNPTVAPSLLTQ